MSAATGAAPVHGHVILRWLSEQAMDDASLRRRVAAELGREVRFRTCDTDDLTFDALLALLVERGKIVRDGEGWRAEMSRVCADA